MATNQILRRAWQWLMTSPVSNPNLLTAAQLADTLADDPRAQLRYFGRYVNVNENQEFIKAWQV